MTYDISAESIVFLVNDSESAQYARAIRKLELPESIKATFFTPDELKNPEVVEYIRTADVLVPNMMGYTYHNFVMENIDPSHTRVYIVSGSSRKKQYKKKGFVFSDEILAYRRYKHVDNLRNMIYKLANLELGQSIPCAPPLSLPKSGIYYPGAPKLFTNYADFIKWRGQCAQYREDAPWVGITMYASYFTEDGIKHVDYLVNELETAGLNVLPVFGRGKTVFSELLLDEHGKSRIGLLLSYTMRFNSIKDKVIRAAVLKMNVPIICLVKLYRSTIDEWEKNPQGLKPFSVAFALTIPELSGLIEPSVVIGKVEQFDPKTGKKYYVYKAVNENIRKLVTRVKKWLELRKTANREKKIAMFFYSHGGKHEIGASYLNIFRSMREIFVRMRKDGYNIGKNNLSEEQIQEMILKSARNIGEWAPGELDQMLLRGKTILLPVKTYKKWFEKLPEEFRKKVVEKWGTVDSCDAMTRNGNFIIPAVILDNLVVLPQPTRGWGSDPVKLAHSTSLAPHHQYIAVYLWINKVFKANAMIHLGRHGSYEWLPGKQCGLSWKCSPQVVITDLPNAYIYTVDGVGEGMQVKRRGHGVIVDHMTPAVKKSGIYHEYGDILAIISSLELAEKHDSRTVPLKREEIGEKIRKLGIAKELEINASDIDDDAIEKIEHYLLEISTSIMPYGMHTYGLNPTGDALTDTIDIIAEYNPYCGKTNAKQKLLGCGPGELNSLINVLNGGYVPPGEGNDPIRNPDAIPTGRNFYGIDPNKIPSKAAYKLGVKAAEEIIQKNLEKSGKYPEKVAFVLWATEAIRNEGVNESTALALMGLKPKWGRGGRVSGVEVISGAVLKRPRIDVLITTSGAYRDQFTNVMMFLDRAVKTAAAQTDVENLIRKHNRRLQKKLERSGISPGKAKKYAELRVFAPAAAAYGTGIADITFSSGNWEKDDVISDTYMRRIGHVYGEGILGEPARPLLEANLENVDVAVHSRSSNIYGVMDNDDCFQYLGGLAMSVRKLSGKSPLTIITVQTQPGKVEINTLQKYVGRELRTRYLNPKWIEGMKKENYAGAREMADFLENFWGWQVTVPDAISDEQWQQCYEVYVEDKYNMDLKKFQKVCPWAFQSISARMLEAIRKNYWKNVSEKVRRTLAADYAMNAIENGMACCEHTCNNPLLSQMVVNIISIPGVMSPEMAMKFQITFEQATGEKLKKQVQERKAQLKERNARYSKSVSPDSEKTNKKERQETTKKQNKSDQKKEAGGEAKELESVKGLKMDEVKQKDEKTKMTSSGIEWLVSIIVFAILAVFYFGYKKKC